MTAEGAAGRAIVLVDAEHHPDAVASALDALDSAGHEIVAVLYVGGSEKVDRPGEAPDVGHPTVWPDEPERALRDLLDRHVPDLVIDRTADPVVTDRRRGVLAAIVLAAGVRYEAPGVSYRPLHRPVLTDIAAVAVIATGKRTGKTALSGALARHAASHGRVPCVVAMGRGGPSQPVVIPADSQLGVDELAAIAANGEHAASDFYEDAVMTGVATVGCRRVGEGPTGEVGHSNVQEGMARLRDLAADLAVLEGSGAAIPPAHADANLLVVPATADPRDLYAMLPLRFLLADLVVFTMADPRLVARDQLAAVDAAVGEILQAVGVGGDGPPPATIRTVFRPAPLGDVAGRRVFVATTAPQAVGRTIRDDLTEDGAEVVGITHALSNRPQLRADLEAAPEHDVLLTELKAAAVDVAAAAARTRGVETLFYDNRPVSIEPDRDLDVALADLIEVSDTRWRARFRSET